MTQEEKHEIIHRFAWQSAEANVVQLYGVTAQSIQNPQGTPFYRSAWAGAMRANYTSNFLQLLYLSDDEAARVCDQCGEYMTTGYVAEAGWSYYCSRACLHRSYTPAQWEERVKQDGEGFGFRDFNPTIHRIIDRHLEELTGPGRLTEAWAQGHSLTPEIVRNVRQMERLLDEYRQQTPVDETRIGGDYFCQIYRFEKQRLSPTADRDLAVDLGSLGFQLLDIGHGQNTDPIVGMYSPVYLCALKWDGLQMYLTYFPDERRMKEWIEYIEHLDKSQRQQVRSQFAIEMAHIQLPCDK